MSSSRSARSLTGRLAAALRRWRRPPPTAPTAIPCRRSRRPCGGTRPPRGANAGPAHARPRAASRSGAGSSTAPACRWSSLGNRVRDLAFEVELLLAADVQLALDRVRRARRTRLRRRRASGASAAAHTTARRAPPAGSGWPAVPRTSTCARRAARRALSWLSATTMKIGWPTYCTRPSARIGSSWMIGPQSLSARDVGHGQHRDHAARWRGPAPGRWR